METPFLSYLESANIGVKPPINLNIYCKTPREFSRTFKLHAHSIGGFDSVLCPQ
jgi:hypothetical protein